MKKTYSGIRRSLIITLAAAGCGWLGSASAANDAYPSRPVRLLVGFSAGGAVDNVARQLGHGMSQKLGQPIVIENKPGATGTIAADAVVNRLQEDIRKTLADAATKTKLEAQGLTVMGNSSDQFRAYMKTETVKWAKLVESAQIKPE